MLGITKEPLGTGILEHVGRDSLFFVQKVVQEFKPFSPIQYLGRTTMAAKHYEGPSYPGTRKSKELVTGLVLYNVHGPLLTKNVVRRG